MMTTKLAIAGTLLALALQPVMAQNKKIYRCEDAAGRITYSDEACKGGAELKNTDERSADERKAAADVAKREQALGDKLARERRAAEKAARPGGAAHITHSAAEEAAKAKPSAKTTSKKKTVTTEQTQPQT
jgi:predicted  nucleic acid-binding Zn-ribbon protein